MTPAPPSPAAVALVATAERILVLAPVGRDAALLAEVLNASGIEVQAAASMAMLLSLLAMHLPDEVGAIIIAEEALLPSQAQELIAILGKQPPWSDVPLIVVGNHRSPTPKRLAFLEELGLAGSVMMLERPFHARTLVAAVRVALRSRRRQYEVRDHLQAHLLSAEELTQRASELQRSNTELEQFAAVASHDLQEPLRMITNYLQLLQHQYPNAFDGKAVAYMRHVTDGADRMRTMILAILTYSKVGEGGVQFEPIDAMVALRDARSALEGPISSRHALLHCDPLPVVLANRVLLSQVFQNLIANALKFCIEQPVIHIGVREAPGEWIFSVADNGIGIPLQSRERLFKIFQRLHDRKEFQGTGIGLATCRKIIDLHRGRIWVESRPDEGSTFLFALPR